MKRQIWIMLLGAVVVIAVLLMLSPTAFPAVGSSGPSPETIRHPRPSGGSLFERVEVPPHPAFGIRRT